VAVAQAAGAGTVSPVTAVVDTSTPSYARRLPGQRFRGIVAAALSIRPHCNRRSHLGQGLRYLPDRRFRGITPQALASDVTTPVAPEQIATCPIDDSAESTPYTSVSDAITVVAPEQFVTCPIDDSAESRSSEIPSRSLLDRLLDEADALRIAEAAAHGEPEASSSPVEASARGLITGRAPGRLQQRADAARRAFHRADALISVAQGYLRGDRPNRSPIEVVLTIPASSLRAGAADSLEVGEMGESFVSREAARRLSLLCSLHHRFVHEYGHAIELGPDRRPRFRDRHGRLVLEVPERPMVADLGWPRIRVVNAPLSITADTIACGWDGTPANYGEIVGHLWVADGLWGARASAPHRA
jgi:hypothetical protein